MTDAPLVRAEDDIGLLCLVIANGFTSRVLDELVAEGFPDTRVSHGFIVQGLLAGDTTVTQLAERLGTSVQAASKTVREMEALGYLDRSRDPNDGRASLLALSEKGRANLAASREARADVMAALQKALGEKRTHEFTELLRLAAAEFGGLETLASRRIRPLVD